MFYKYINLYIAELWERAEKSCQCEAEYGTSDSEKATGKVPKEGVKALGLGRG